MNVNVFNHYHIFRSDTIFYISVHPISVHMRLFERPKKKISNNYKTLTLKVPGMHCEGCAQNIQKSLSKINGLTNVQADFGNGEVHMEFDENKVNLEKIRSAIRKVGFIPGVEQVGS